jgi:hypothetical protein
MAAEDYWLVRLYDFLINCLTTVSLANLRGKVNCQTIFASGLSERSNTAPIADPIVAGIGNPGYNKATSKERRGCMGG